jgi:penicillin-binding protein 2
MAKVRIYEDLSPLLKRSKITLIMIGVFIFIMTIIYWKIQILDHKKYIIQATRNWIREANLPAQRGLIKDRNGVILAENRASFNVSLIRENCKNLSLSIKKISRLLNIDEKILKDRINQYRFYPKFRPIIIKENLKTEEIIKIEALKVEFPELVIQFEPKRFYPFNEIGAHVIGYVQEASKRELENSKLRNLKIGDIIGKTGIEKYYEQILRGKEGKVKKVVDSRGRLVRILNRKEPISGKNLSLTIDFDLQKKAQQLLAGREGAIVAIEPKSGEVLALISSPSYDPNKFVQRFNQDEWNKLINNPKSPLENRATRGLYAPGSIFKLTLALAGLEKGTINLGSSFFCSGKAIFFGKEFLCWNPGGHGKVNIFNAIRHSCNIYFYNLGKLLGVDAINYWAHELGYGNITGIDLPGEKKGLIPSPEWKKKISQNPWFPGETITISIGQGPILVTPLQVAVHTAIIANRGEKIIPHLLKSDSKRKYSLKRINIKREYFEEVIRGMWEAVNLRGTGRLAKLEGLNICGKTGSTEIVGKKNNIKEKIKTHSWFTGFAPRDNPQIVITVIVEYGGLGGETAAPLARELFKFFWKKNAI